MYIVQMLRVGNSRSMVGMGGKGWKEWVGPLEEERSRRCRWIGSKLSTMLWLSSLGGRKTEYCS